MTSSGTKLRREPTDVLGGGSAALLTASPSGTTKPLPLAHDTPGQAHHVAMNAKERRQAQRAAKQAEYASKGKTGGVKAKTKSSDANGGNTAAPAQGVVDAPSPTPAPAWAPIKAKSAKAPEAAADGTKGTEDKGAEKVETEVAGGSGGSGNGGGPAAAEEPTAISLFDGIPTDAPMPKLIVFDLDATLW